MANPAVKDFVFQDTYEESIVDENLRSVVQKQVTDMITFASAFKIHVFRTYIMHEGKRYNLILNMSNE